MRPLFSLIGFVVLLSVIATALALCPIYQSAPIRDKNRDGMGRRSYKQSEGLESRTVPTKNRPLRKRDSKRSQAEAAKRRSQEPDSVWDYPVG